MAKLERITVTMPQEMAARLRAAVERGEYATTSEVVREALRDWGDEQERKEAGLERLRGLISAGENSEALDGDTVLQEFQAYVAQLVSEVENDKAA